MPDVKLDQRDADATTERLTVEIPVCGLKIYDSAFCRGKGEMHPTAKGWSKAPVRTQLLDFPG